MTKSHVPDFRRMVAGAMRRVRSTAQDTLRTFAEEEKTRFKDAVRGMAESADGATVISQAYIDGIQVHVLSNAAPVLRLKIGFADGAVDAEGHSLNAVAFGYETGSLVTGRPAMPHWSQFMPWIAHRAGLLFSRPEVVRRMSREIKEAIR